MIFRQPFANIFLMLKKENSDKPDKKEELLLEMLRAGVHFGHQKSKWNPKMAKYVYAVRHHVHIIDLEQTYAKLQEAQNFISDINKKNQQILFVGTKKQAQKIIREAAESVNMPYVAERWLGGTFTNFKTVIKLAEKLKKLEEKLEEKLSTRDKHKTQQEISRLKKKVWGIRNMKELPAAAFISDIKENQIAVKEARAMKVPLVALVDTNTDPSEIDYPIPANDDALGSIKLLIGEIIKPLEINA